MTEENTQNQNSPANPLPSSPPTSDRPTDVNKNDPQYNMKVNSIVRKRLNDIKLETEAKKRATMEAGMKRPQTLRPGESNLARRSQPIRQETLRTQQQIPAPAPTQSQQAPQTPSPEAVVRDPEGIVYNKDIAKLVAQLNNSFAILEEFRVKTENFRERTEAILKNLENSFK